MLCGTASATPEVGLFQDVLSEAGLVPPMVEPAPAPLTLSDIAHEWLAAGVERIADDPAEAVGYFHQAIALGSDEAMSWLGAALLSVAIDMPLREGGGEVALHALGWLETALYALPDDEAASARLTHACEVLPDHIIAEWQAKPLHFQVTVN
jgi:hypothetical protein